MSEPKQPGVSLRLRVTRDAADDDKRYSTRPYAGTAFTEGRVRKGGWGTIRRELSDDNGQPRMATASVLLNDDDGAIREALAEDETRFIEDTEAELTVLSEAGRAASLDDRTLMRARLANVYPENTRNGQQRSRGVRLEFVDALAPYYDQTIPRQVFLRADYPDIHRDLENTPIPVIYGEHNDDGAEDVNGTPAAKGMVPAIYVGSRRTVDDDPHDGEPSFLAPPTVTYEVVGTPGTRTLYYGFTKLSPYGETVLSAIIQVDNAPAVLSPTDYIRFEIDHDEADATGYVVYGRRNATPARRLRVLGTDLGSPASPAFVEYIDDGSDSEYAPGPPAVNTAQIELGSPAEGGFFWDFYVICKGYITIDKLYGSNVQAGVEPARIDITATEGVDWIRFNGLIGGIEITGFYARGPRSQHHIDGIVTMAVQTCGREDVGDGSGDSIQAAFYQLQHLLNEEVLKDGGTGYVSGLWGPLETFNDGSPATPMLKTSAFEACQQMTIDWLGGSPSVGYTGAIYLREPITVRQFLQQWLQTFEAHQAVNHHGQFYPVLYNAGADETAGRHYRERSELLGIENPVLDRDHVEKNVAYQFDFDPDANRMRSEVIRVNAELTKGVRLLRYTRDAATAEDAMERRVARLSQPRWKQTIITKYLGLENEPGDQIRVTHADGPTATGWTARPFFVTGHSVDANRGEVRLTGYDLLPLLEAGSP